MLLDICGDSNMNLTRKNFACERQDVPASSPQYRLDLRDARSRPLRSLPSGRFSRNHDPVRIQTVFQPSGELRFPGSCNDALAQVPSPHCARSAKHPTPAPSLLRSASAPRRFVVRHGPVWQASMRPNGPPFVIFTPPVLAPNNCRTSALRAIRASARFRRPSLMVDARAPKHSLMHDHRASPAASPPDSTAHRYPPRFASH